MNDKPKTYDASGEPVVREILNVLQRFKDRNLSTGEMSNVLRISVQVHNLIQQREEARITALTLAAAIATARSLAESKKPEADDTEPEAFTIVDDVVRQIRERDTSLSAPYWPKGDV